MEFLFFDCFSGISGDMIIGALLDSGASFEHLRQGIAALPIESDISVRKQLVQGISCSSFTVESRTAPVRHLRDILEIINTSSLSLPVKNGSALVFHKIAAAEAAVHDIDPGEVHFHEIGAVDTIVDIVGTYLCLESMGLPKVYSSPLPWTQGFVDISHGRYPLPAPATALLLRGYPCNLVAEPTELVTPTGAALLTSIASPVNNLPAFIPVKIGYGAGRSTRTDKVPNLLRIMGARIAALCLLTESVSILETEVDDLNPEIFSHLHQLFTTHPAVHDYFTTAVQMKKNRPGILITVVTVPEAESSLASLLLQESGSLGVRCRQQKRYLLSRRDETIITPWGPVRVKVALVSPGELRVKPEFDDCQAIAIREKLPLLKIYTVINGIIASHGMNSD